ncbi:MAG: hypothetical protein KA715_04055 [Xanthomonadaceae bacterium]|nr:hypothetical protein [Xanthomonadaceae bacterium]
MIKNPLIYTYLKKFQEDPQSRVFAPLSEAYRKAGLVDEAIAIAQEGLAHHPHFMGGRVALARALFDKKRYPLVIETLTPVIREAPDNIVAQRLFAESCLIQGQFAQALDAYKMLLYLNPKDQEVARLIKEIEPQAYDKGNIVLQADYQVKMASKAIDDDPVLKRSEWMRRIEKLQDMLKHVERYRVDSSR